jgi:peroxiredoxin|tara:strand:- start:47 stop:418 length:372 start_codon:yes stop_codon:yes gene_type:complete
LQKVLGELEELGASLVAITPQLAEHSRTMIKKHALNYHLVMDPGNDYAAQLGLRFQVPPDLKAVYDGFGIDLPKYNGDDSWTLAVPARFVIDQSSVIRAADIEVDYTYRPEADKTIADLRALA